MKHWVRVYSSSWIFLTEKFYLDNMTHWIQLACGGLCNVKVHEWETYWFSPPQQRKVFWCQNIFKIQNTLRHKLQNINIKYFFFFWSIWIQIQNTYFVFQIHIWNTFIPNTTHVWIHLHSTKLTFITWLWLCTRNAVILTWRDKKNNKNNNNKK